MYVPAHFSVPDDDVPALLGSLDVGELVTAGPDGLEATPLPWVYDPSAGERGVLVGHVARTNTQWRLAGQEVLVIARGPEHYVSPAWLPSTATHGRVVPTWDYVQVHVYGELVAHEDPAWVRDCVVRLSERHESRREAPWSLDRAPQDWVAGQLRAVVGLEIRVTRWVAKAKMSQNKTPADVAAQIDELTRSGQTEAAAYKSRHSLPAAERRVRTLAAVAAGRRRAD